MSLDVYLMVDTPIKKQGTGVFVREDGATRELTQDEVAAKFPNAVAAPLQEFDSNWVYESNITHNLGTMADKAGIYYALWRPEEREYTHARDIIPVLEKGLADLQARPEYFEQFNADNGWGLYKNFVPFVAEYLAACKEYPDARIEVSR